MGDLESQPSDRDSLLFPTENPSMDFERHWQDLLNIMEPEVTRRKKRKYIC